MERRFSIGWVLVSYLMIAGGFMLAGVTVYLARVSGDWVGQAAFFGGAFTGGFFAGRASPGKTIAEPGLAGVLLILTVFGVTFLVPGARDFSFASADDPMLAALKLGFVTGLGGFIGGLVGERTSSGEPSQSGWRWWGIACLINVGLTYLLLGLFAILALRSGDASGDNVPLLAIAAFALGSLGSGFVTQAIAPRAMRGACGAGPVGLMGFVLVVNGVTGDLTTDMFLGAVIIGGIAVLVGAIGARVSWSLIGARRTARPVSASVPEARLR
jgi:hypothetical protein